MTEDTATVVDGRCPWFGVGPCRMVGERVQIESTSANKQPKEQQ